jgi:5'-phosphate synthase pdxT subunit
MSMLLESSGLFDPWQGARTPGLPVFGTCAGMILLATIGARRPTGDQRRFGAIDLSVRRNGYGRHWRRSSAISTSGLGGPVHAVFIRAPVVESRRRRGRGPGRERSRHHPGRRRPSPAATVTDPGIRTRRWCAARVRCWPRSFHPELTGDRRLHQLFVEMTEEERR